MTTNNAASNGGPGMGESEEAMSRFDQPSEAAEILGIRAIGPGQNCPRHCPTPADAASVLGEPLSIQEVAHLLGCSTWTVRHGYLIQGLPHFRSGPMGKLIFFRNQVVRWILEQQQQQQKGGR